MKPIYIGYFQSKEDIACEFRIDIEELEDVEILFAFYDVHDYEGDAFVLSRKDGILYEVNGSHCSCYGLEGQWEPEEADLKELKHRIEEGTLGCGLDDENKFANELKELIEELERVM